jgi:hypothetical protein
VAAASVVFMAAVQRVPVTNTEQSRPAARQIEACAFGMKPGIGISAYFADTSEYELTVAADGRVAAIRSTNMSGLINMLVQTRELEDCLSRWTFNGPGRVQVSVWVAEAERPWTITVSAGAGPLTVLVPGETVPHIRSSSPEWIYRTTDESLHGTALKALAAEISGRWQKYDDSLNGARAKTDWNNIIVERRGQTFDLPSRIGGTHILLLDSEQLIKRRKAIGKNFKVMVIGPVTKEGTRLAISMSFYWFGYRRGLFSTTSTMTLSDAGVVYLRYDCATSQYVVDEVRLSS